VVSVPPSTHPHGAGVSVATVPPPVLVAVVGPPFAGKTAVCEAVAAGMGPVIRALLKVRGGVPSPTGGW